MLEGFLVSHMYILSKRFADLASFKSIYQFYYSTERITYLKLLRHLPGSHHYWHLIRSE